MKNIIDDLAAFIQSRATLIASPLYLDAFPTPTGDAVMLRAIAGQSVETRYLDKTRAGQWPFSIFARSNDSAKAYNQLCDLVSVLDLAGVPLSDETLITIEPTSSPALVQQTEAGDYTYSSGFLLDYTTRG